MHAVSRVDDHVLIGDVRYPTCNVVQAVNCLACDDFREPPHKPAAIIQVSQRAVKTRGRHFKRVRVIEREVSVENRAEVPADSSTIVEVDRLLRRVSSGLTICLWPVDKNSEHPANRLRRSCTSKISSPKLPATRSAIARTSSTKSSWPTVIYGASCGALNTKSGRTPTFAGPTYPQIYHVGNSTGNDGSAVLGSRCSQFKASVCAASGDTEWPL